MIGFFPSFFLLDTPLWPSLVSRSSVVCQEMVTNGKKNIKEKSPLIVSAKKKRYVDNKFYAPSLNHGILQQPANLSN